jgi:GNAT superfamily N-acetyltransferase
MHLVLADDQHRDDAWLLLQEYYNALRVMVRDEQASVSSYLRAGGHGWMWLAYVGGEPAGCVILRELPESVREDAPDGRGVKRATCGEVKRLYVRPQFRRLGVAARLMAALEMHATSMEMTALYLDSMEHLREAITFYRRSGYEFCERYNDNPQATIFLRKALC